MWNKILFLFLTGFACSNALNVGHFENVTSGVWNAWKAASPENVKHDRFAMVSAGGSLYLVSRRLHRTGFDAPWDPASRGGIVSAYALQSKTWTHKPYDRLAEDKFAEVIFSLNGHPFMLTHYFQQGKIVYGKLFFWSVQRGRWIEVPITVEPVPTTGGPNDIRPGGSDIQALAIHVPNPAGKDAYLAVSNHGRATLGSRMEFSKLTIEFGSNKLPTKGTVKFEARKDIDQPSAVLFMATPPPTGDNLIVYAFVQTFLSEGYESEAGYAFTLDTKTKKVGQVNFTGGPPPMSYGSVFSTKEGEVVLAGGSRFAGLGHTEEVFDIWSLNLKTRQWKSANSTIPEDIARTETTYDLVNGKYYLAGLKEGISVATIK